MSSQGDPPGPLQAWSRLDPTGILSRVVGIAQRLPGFPRLERRVAAIERDVLRTLREREDGLVGPPPALHSGENGVPKTPAELLGDLLRTSIEETASDSSTRHFVHILRRLVPDEARILAALADGTAYPLIDVVVKPSRRNGNAGPLLQNASTVGRRAGVALPARVPVYVADLRALGLVEVGPEDRSLTTEYDILETETAVHDAKLRAASAGGHGAAVIRRTLRITGLGRELWAAAGEAHIR